MSFDIEDDVFLEAYFADRKTQSRGRANFRINEETERKCKQSSDLEK